MSPIALSALIYGLTFVGTVVVFVLLGLGIYAHRWLRSRFLEATSALEGRNRIGSGLVASMALNLAYFTILYFVPYQTLAGSVPFGVILENVIPKSFDEFMGNPVGLIWFIFFSSTGGPATILAVRYFRSSADDEEVGKSTLAVLQVLCYVAWIFLALSYPLPPDSARRFASIFTMFVLPGTFTGVSMIASISRVRQVSQYIR